MDLDVDFEALGHDGELFGGEICYSAAIGGRVAGELALEACVMMFVAVEYGCGMADIAEGSKDGDLGIYVLRCNWVRGRAILNFRGLEPWVSVCMLVTKIYPLEILSYWPIPQNALARPGRAPQQVTWREQRRTSQRGSMV